MQLPFLKNREPEKSYFLAFLIKPHRIGAILFEEVSSNLSILAFRDEDINVEGDLSEESLIEGGDKAISAVEASLPKGAVLEKTIFSVPYDWILDGKIKDEHLKKLKKVCQDLGLVPMGYLTSIEAVVSHLGTKDGAPVSAVFVEVAGSKVLVYLVRAGKILEVHEGSVGDNVILEVENLLKKITTVDVLPSKIILLEHRDVESAQQEFISHTWDKDIPFLHLPQVMILEKGVENDAIVNGVASQMDLAVTHAPHAPKEEEEVDDVEKKEEIKEVEGEDFGFLKEGDVAEEKAEEDENANIGTPEETPNIDGNVEEPNISYFKEEGEGSDKGESDDQSEKKENKAALALPALPSISFLKNIKIPSISSLKMGGSNALKLKIGLAIAAVIVVLVGLSYLYYNVILQAEVTVFADKKAIDKSVDVVFAEKDEGDDVIPLTLVDEEINAQETRNATGVKETGETAKGEITIYNKTENEKKFASGTIIVGPNDLEFELQDEITVASTSSFSTSLSSKKGKVEAAAFGKEYNLPSNTNFTVKGFSSSQFIAKNDSAITGGTKKEITVVSQDDLDKLISAVLEKHEKEAVEKAKSGAPSDTVVFPEALSGEVTDEEFTKKVGDESGNVAVSAKIVYKVGEYKKSDLQNYINSLTEGDIPGTYTLAEGDSKVDITDIEVEDDNRASATLKVNAVYVPKIENKAVLSKLKGKMQEDAIEEIKKIGGVEDVVVNFKRKLPIFPLIFPLNEKNIKFEIKN